MFTCRPREGRASRPLSSVPLKVWENTWDELFLSNSTRIVAFHVRLSVCAPEQACAWDCRSRINSEKELLLEDMDVERSVSETAFGWAGYKMLGVERWYNHQLVCLILSTKQQFYRNNQQPRKCSLPSLSFLLWLSSSSLLSVFKLRATPSALPTTADSEL